MRQWRELNAVTDRIGKIASFFGGDARGDRITGCDRRVGLPRQDLAEPPAVARLTGEFGRFGEILPSQLGVVGGGKAAGGQRSGQHRRIVDVARERHGLLRSTRAVGNAEQQVNRRLVGQRPGAYCCVDRAVLGYLVGEGGIEPGPPFHDVAPRLPQR